MSKHTINISHEFDASAKDLFDQIREGKLFKLTGADKIGFDFLEGGNFSLIFNDRGKIDGEFVRIIPDKLVEVNWNVNGFGRVQEVNTKVTVAVHNNSKRSSIAISHTEIQNLEAAMAKQAAWTEILIELEKESKDNSSLKTEL